MRPPPNQWTLNVDLPSAIKLNRLKLTDLEAAELQAGYRKLVPPAAPPPDLLRQAELLHDEGFIGEAELGDRLNLSVHTLRRWRVDDRGPPYYKLSAAKRAPVRYCWPEVLQWLRDNFRVRPACPVQARIAYRAGQTAKWEAAGPEAPANSVDQILARLAAIAVSDDPEPVAEPEPEPPPPEPLSRFEALKRRIEAARARHPVDTLQSSDGGSS